MVFAADFVNVVFHHNNNDLPIEERHVHIMKQLSIDSIFIENFVKMIVQIFNDENFAIRKTMMKACQALPAFSSLTTDETSSLSSEGFFDKKKISVPAEEMSMTKEEKRMGKEKRKAERAEKRMAKRKEEEVPTTMPKTADKEEKKTGDMAKEMFDRDEITTICMWFFPNKETVCSSKGNLTLKDGIPLCDKCSKKKTANPFIKQYLSKKAGLTKKVINNNASTSIIKPPVSKPTPISQMIKATTTDEEVIMVAKPKDVVEHVVSEKCKKFSFGKTPEGGKCYVTFKNTDNENVLIGTINDDKHQMTICKCVNPETGVKCGDVWNRLEKEDEEFVTSNIQFLIKNEIFNYKPDRLGVTFSILEEEE